MRVLLILLSLCCFAEAGNTSCTNIWTGSQWLCVNSPSYSTAFDGVTPGAQIDAACASSARTLVEVPADAATGNSVAGLSDGCTLRDNRGSGLDVFGNTAGGAHAGIVLRNRSTGVPAGFNVQTMQIGMEAYAGGTNHSNGPKNNYSALTATMVGRTRGQTNAYSFSNFHFSNGDTVGLDGVAQSWGRNNAGGDEGTEAITVAALQGDRVFTGTVTAIGAKGNVSVGTDISYTSPVNENTRGDDRPLIITTPAKVYSQGTVVTVAGVPPTVTGDGNQDWTTLAPVGPVSNLFMALDVQTNGVLMLVVPVRSIIDATHLVLDYVSEGNDANLPAPALPSTYKIFRGGNVISMPFIAVGGEVLPVLGNVQVWPSDDFAVGDTFQEPLGYAHTIQGIHLHVGQKLPFSSNAGGSGVVAVNDATGVSIPQGFAFTGPVDTPFYADTVKIDGMQIRNNPPGALVKSGWSGGGVTNMLGAFTSVGQNTFLSYDRTIDTWKTTRPISAPSFACAGVVGANCNGPLSQTATIRCGIITSC